MISHNSSKEVIEITQSGGKKKISESKVKFSCHEFFSQIQNSISYLPDTKFYFVPPRYKISDSASPLFCFLTFPKKLYFESSTSFPKILHANIN